MKKILYIISSIIALFIMSSATTSKKLYITSEAFVANGIIPEKYSCSGKEVNPPLHISGAPDATQSVALIVHDPDAPMPGGMTHWVIWNLPPNADIPEDYKDGDQGLNGKKEKGYTGMCPPSGTHHYHFMAYALDKKLDLDANTDEASLKKAMNGHVIAQGELIGLFSKK